MVYKFVIKGDPTWIGFAEHPICYWLKKIIVIELQISQINQKKN